MLHEQVQRKSISRVFIWQTAGKFILQSISFFTADFGLSIIEPSCLSYYYCLPNKLFEYLMADIPVVVSNMKEMTKLVQENKAGVVVESLASEQIKQSILELLSMNYFELQKNIQTIKTKYCWEIQGKILATAYQKLLGNKKDSK
jgi:glycosyltransferase involved in cell wall biosynthesis